jgi:acid phosphatase family membrane protein YuiD
MLIHLNVLGLFSTPWFWSAFTGWTLAQSAKMLTGLIQTRRLDLRYLVSTGGMPSAHSAMTCGLAASIGMTEGFSTPAAILSFSFAGITMFDAAGVRRAAGQQARILNQMIDDFFVDHHFSEKRLKELLGHTRLEVFVGMILGILCAIVITTGWHA